MIEATELLQKMGKKKFIEMASRRAPGETMGERQKRRRWGVRGIKIFQICEHGKITIKGGKFTHACRSCEVETPITKLKDFEAHFNIGLGCYVESKRDFKRTCKDKGLTHIGDDGYQL